MKKDKQQRERGENRTSERVKNKICSDIYIFFFLFVSRISLIHKQNNNYDNRWNLNEKDE